MSINHKGLVTCASLAGGVAAAAGIEVATYPLWRQWCLHWGATNEEASASLPGDDLLADPNILSTRAIQIDAPASLIWPWLVQMGPGRGGAYTYDWIENMLGLNMHSAHQIVPEYQNLAVGDEKRLGAHGPVLRVEILEPERALVFRSADGNWVWALSLIPNGRYTRLISRNRINAASGSPLTRAINNYVMEPGSLIMERKMLLGIKERAERPVSGAGDQPTGGEK